MRTFTVQMPLTVKDTFEVAHMISGLYETDVLNQCIQLGAGVFDFRQGLRSTPSRMSCQGAETKQIPLDPSFWTGNVRRTIRFRLNGQSYQALEVVCGKTVRDQQWVANMLILWGATVLTAAGIEGRKVTLVAATATGAYRENLSWWPS